jgi:hypothetical protein
MNTFEEAFNRFVFRDRMRQLMKHGPIDVEPSPQKPEPEIKPQKEGFILTIDKLYRMPLGHNGDIPRHCQVCKELPTQFAVAYSDRLRLCYFFCNEHFIQYINKPLSEKDDDRKSKRSNHSVTTDGTNRTIGTDGNNRRKSIPDGTSEVTGDDSGIQREGDEGVEASWIQPRRSPISKD